MPLLVQIMACWWSMPINQLNQCILVSIGPLRTFEGVSWIMLAILFRPQCVNMSINHRSNKGTYKWSLPFGYYTCACFENQYQIIWKLGYMLTKQEQVCVLSISTEQVRRASIRLLKASLRLIPLTDDWMMMAIGVHITHNTVTMKAYQATGW